MEELMGKDLILEDDDLKFSNNQDFAIVIGYENLKQSIINRLKTIKGEYYNEFYGSELNKCYSSQMNQSLKNQMIGYIVEALNQEPRIKSQDKIDIQFNKDDRIAMIEITITPINTNNSLNLIFPYFVE